MKTPVTHCVQPNAGDISQAVIGIAYGVPQKWYILPTQRYGDFVCAEVTHIGPMSYFVPRTGNEETLNIDLIWSTTVTTRPAPTNFFCKDVISFRWAIKNDGFEAAPNYVLRVTNVAVRTGQVTAQRDIVINGHAPGATLGGEDQFTLPSTFFNEANRLVFQIDGNNNVAELNEANNTQIIDYILKERSSGCGE